MKYLLDTHVLLWWFLDSPELPQNYAQVLADCEQEGESFGISAISLWEIAQLVSRGRLKFSFSLDRWLKDLEEDPLLQILQLSGPIILESARLGEKFHKDPADRLIAATARQEGLKLLTMDSLIRSSGTVVVL